MNRRRPKRQKARQRVTDQVRPPDHLRTRAEVARIWAERTGTRQVSPGMIYQILKSAHRKIAKAICEDPELCRLLGLPPVGKDS